MRGRQGRPEVRASVVAVHGQSRRALRGLRTRLVGSASSVRCAPNAEAASAMTYTTEEFVRHALRRILRGDKYRNRFVCLTCLVTMTLERLHPGWRKSEIARAMDKVYATPGIPMESRASFRCTHCQKTMPCLGAPYL